MTDAGPKINVPKKCGNKPNGKCSHLVDESDFESACKTPILTQYLRKTGHLSPHTYACKCGRFYKHRQSLFTHKKKCIHATESGEMEKDEPHSGVTKPASESPALITNEMILNLIEQNQELQKQLVELSRHTKIVNHTTNNTTNNQFNLNVFLNEDCKDALNIVDFIESLKLTVNDLEQTGKLGYMEGITRIFVQALKQLDVNLRPLHCTDMKRETVYIKDQDTWEKENVQKTKLRNVLRKIARKNLQMLPIWQAQNPDFRFLDTRENDTFVQITLSALGPESREDQEKQEDKIIRNVLKEVGLEKKPRISE